MGKPIASQCRGKASPLWRAKKHKYTLLNHKTLKSRTWEVLDFKKDKHRIVAKIVSDAQVGYILAAEGMAKGQIINPVKVVKGGAYSLAQIPLKTRIYSLQPQPGKKSLFLRAPGTYGVVSNHIVDALSQKIVKVAIKLRSGRVIECALDCLAQIGVVAGGDMALKPFLKAGTAHWHYKRNGGSRWPRVSAVAMNAVEHVFGGQSHRPGRSKSSHRNSPPGRKCGNIASSRTGRKK